MNIKKIFHCGETEFSSDKHVLIVAEVGTSHGGSLTKAKQLIDAAVDCGADAVKFQIVYADEILHPKTGIVDLPTGKISLYENFKRLEVGTEFFEACAEYCKRKKVLFSASPFGAKSAQELAALKPAFVKIASPELNYVQLLEQVAKQDLPVILSSGVSHLSDIETAITVLKKCLTKDIALLHCITSYPAPEEEYNISLLETLQKIFGVAVGISDHSKNEYLVPALSVSCGAAVIEKHFCLSNDDGGLDDPIALTPDAFTKMVMFVRECTGLAKEECVQKLLQKRFSKELIKKVLGTGEKKLADSEAQNYGRTNRSLHYIHDLKSGHRLTEDDIRILRTEKILTVGDAPALLPYFLGSVLQCDVSAGSGAKLFDIINR
jgi:NeuB family protein